MNTATLAILMFAIVVIFVIFEKQLKIPMNFVLFIVPTVFSFLLGFNLQQTSTLILNQLSTVMNQTGYMLLFGLIYFVMLSETGMFDTIVGAIIKLIGKRMNIFTIMILTTVISAVGFLTANMSTTYLIVFPIMLPFFKRYQLDRDYALIIAQTAIAAAGWLPWGIGVVLTATIADMPATKLAGAAFPWMFCFIPAIIFQYLYFAYQHKKAVGTFGLPDDASGDGHHHVEVKVNENARPKFFWFNLALFILVILCLAVFKIPSYLVFIFASIITSVVNYPKDFNKIWNKAGASFFNILIMLIAICFYLAIFNAKPAGDVSMVTALAELIHAVVPGFMLRYFHILMLLLAVPIIYFAPYQLFNAMYPLFISIGATFGLTPLQVIAPFVCNLSLATGVSPINSSTYVGTSLIESEVKTFSPKAAPIMFISNIIVVATAFLTGVLHV